MFYLNAVLSFFVTAQLLLELTGWKYYALLGILFISALQAEVTFAPVQLASCFQAPEITHITQGRWIMLSLLRHKGVKLSTQWKTGLKEKKNVTKKVRERKHSCVHSCIFFLFALKCIWTVRMQLNYLSDIQLPWWIPASRTCTELSGNWESM